MYAAQVLTLSQLPTKADEMNGGVFMQKLLMKIARSEKHISRLKIISRLSSLFVSIVFFTELIILAYRGEYISAVSVAASAGVGFVLVTLLRAAINAPRPYELRDYYKVSPREKSGKSFPSRHAYSAFVIATLAWILHPAVAAITALVALIVCVSRVLSGIHFIRDVVCGALLGILSGIIGIIILI